VPFASIIALAGPPGLKGGLSLIMSLVALNVPVVGS
jgi:hypothetical protein